MSASRLRQRGAAFYLLVLASATLMTMLMLGAGALTSAAQGRADDADQVLAEARAAVLAHLLQADLPLPRIDGITTLAAAPQLGTMRLLPDLPTIAGPGLEAGEPAYDGFADAGGCAFRGWVPGNALQPRSLAGAAARCFGRMPWRELGMAPRNVDAQDAMGLVPWIIVSPNLVDPQGCAGPGTTCTPSLVPMLLDQPFAGFGLPGRAQYPWIRIVDERGNLVSDRVAVAVVLPGPALAGQARVGAAAPTAYLDRLTIGANCPAPCVPGQYDNANYNHADNQPWTLIRGPLDPKAAEAKGFFAAPFNFNDRIAFITIDELMSELEARARTELVAKLRAYKTAKGFLPWAASAGDPTGTCVNGQRKGLVPVADGTCTAGDSLAAGAGQLAPWFLNAGWQRYFQYAVSPVCVRGSAACAGLGLTAGTATNIDALLIAPGTAITAAPFAPSKGAAQLPVNGLALSATLNDWIDDPLNADGNDTFVLQSAMAQPSNDRIHLVSP